LFTIGQVIRNIRKSPFTNQRVVNTSVKKPSIYDANSTLFENKIQGYSIKLPAGWIVENSTNLTENIRILKQHEYPGILISSTKFGDKNSYSPRHSGESLEAWINRIYNPQNKIITHISFNDKKAVLVKFDNITIMGGGFNANKPGKSYVHTLYVELSPTDALSLYTDGSMDDSYYNIDYQDWLKRLTFIDNS
jgi:hypothetical protein